MRTRKHPLTPLAAVAAGLLAGAVGTVCLDAVHYLKYRREGGTESPLAWEFAPVSTWETAPDPGQVAKRLIEGFTQSKLPDRSAGPISTAAHWAFGSANAAIYGVVAGSARPPHPAYSVAFGAAVWAGRRGVGRISGRAGPPSAPESPPVQADHGVRRENPGLGPERAPGLRRGHRRHVLGAGPDPLGPGPPRPNDWCRRFRDA